MDRHRRSSGVAGQATKWSIVNFDKASKGIVDRNRHRYPAHHGRCLNYVLSIHGHQLTMRWDHDTALSILNPDFSGLQTVMTFEVESVHSLASCTVATILSTAAEMKRVICHHNKQEDCEESSNCCGCRTVRTFLVCLFEVAARSLPGFEGKDNCRNSYTLRQSTKVSN